MSGQARTNASSPPRGSVMCSRPAARASPAVSTSRYGRQPGPASISSSAWWYAVSNRSASDAETPASASSAPLMHVFQSATVP